MIDKKLPDMFVSYAADVLAETSSGLSGSQIIKLCNSYAVDFNVAIPITSADFGKFGSIIPNKRTALYKNLVAFNGQQQFVIIKELSELQLFANNESVRELRKKLFERYSSFSVTPIFDEIIEKTGWERVDRSIEEMNNRLKVADTSEKYQAIGMLGRETLISIAQQVYIKAKHPSIDGVDIGATDSKRMFEAYIAYELKTESEKIAKYVKSAIDMSNQLTHDRNASKRAAGICVLAVSSVASLMKYLKEME
ncbi:MAG: hypothetical protein IJQ23_07620 [Clostridia bacterium]|nr:hypothetical protein [Clostridia bacterium]